MARTGRPSLSQEQTAELWRRWKEGETLSRIGRALGKYAASVFGAVAAKVGFALAARSRRCGSLTLLEREEISRGLVAGRSFRRVGRDLRRAVPTISHEEAKNGGRRADRAARADERALERVRRPKPFHLAYNPPLCKRLCRKLLASSGFVDVAGTGGDYQCWAAEAFQVTEFKGAQFPRPVILDAVLFYVRYAVSYRDLEEMLAERGVVVDHATLNRWIVRSKPVIAARDPARKRPTARSWCMDETYIRVKGK